MGLIGSKKVEASPPVDPSCGGALITTTTVVFNRNGQYPPAGHTPAGQIDPEVRRQLSKKLKEEARQRKKVDP